MFKKCIFKHQKIRLHLTNVSGVGATHLMQSLLPSLFKDETVQVESIYLPEGYLYPVNKSQGRMPEINVFRRLLPNSISRVLECTVGGSQFDGLSPLVVFGDLPIRCRAPQVVFVQTPHLIESKIANFNSKNIKYWFSRQIFRSNLNRAKAFIVQTDVMRDNLEKTYPEISGAVHVIPQPVPSWLFQCGLRRFGRISGKERKLRLFYPAANYPHKNHKILSRISQIAGEHIEKLILTIPHSDNPAKHLHWIECSDLLPSVRVVEEYSKTDALVFLSKMESYGFPLIEAMYIGLPIICPDLPYAKTLCGKEAIYFNPDQSNSLIGAIQELRQRLDFGWWPNWSSRLINVPPNWSVVAKRIVDLACG